MRERILHAEDQPLIRALMDEMLHFMGYEVVGAADGEAALARVRTEPFDMVLTDHQMPGMNGLELVRRLHAAGFRGRIYVLAGALADSDRAGYEALGVDGIAIKPLDLWSLHQLLKTGATAG